MRKKLSGKEKREIGLILGAVLLVAIVGVGLRWGEEKKLEAIAGAAVKLDCEIPTYPGVLALLKDSCGLVLGEGNCNQVCGNKSCLPIEEGCDKPTSNGQCWCCSSPC